MFRGEIEIKIDVLIMVVVSQVCTLSKRITSHTLNKCSLFYVNYISICFFLKNKNKPEPIQNRVRGQESIPSKKNREDSWET